MLGLVRGRAGGPAVTAAARVLAWAGLRAGDRPGDVTVTAAMSTVVQPDGCRPVAIAAVRNPGPAAVLVGLSVRTTRRPAWLEAGLTVSVPARTTRPRLRPGRHAVLGVVEPGAQAQWQVPVPAPRPGRGQGRRHRLTAAAGQAGGRLRVIRVPIGATPAAPPRQRQVFTGRHGSGR